MTNKQRVLIASMLLTQSEQEGVDSITTDALTAAAHELVGEDRLAADVCPTAKQLTEIGIQPNEKLHDRFGNDDPYSINRDIWERVNNRYKNAQNTAQAGRL